MCSIILVICVLIPIIGVHCNDTPAVVDAKYGKDMYCHVAFLGAVDPKNMMEYNSPLAKPFGTTKLTGCRLGFVAYEDDIGSVLIADSKEFACGMAYLVPTSEFPKIMEQHTEYKVLSVEVTIKGNQPIAMNCNAFQSIIPSGEEVPVPQKDLQIVIDAYTTGGLPGECIDKLKQIPTTECKATPPP